MNTSVRLAMVVLVGGLAFAGLWPVSAQDASAPQGTNATGGPSTNPAATPDLKLSAAQRQTIYMSVSNLNKKSTPPEGFQSLVGAMVPEPVKLEPMPDTIVELMPQTKGFSFAMVEDQVLVVDPASKKVVEVITGQK